MPDYRVRFVGDLNNLAAFDRAIRNTLTASSKSLNAANEKLVNFQGKGVPIFDPQTSQAGLFRRNVQTTIDSVNRTFIQSGEVVRRVITGYGEEFDKVSGQFVLKPLFDEQYLSSYKKAIGNVTEYEAALTKIEPLERRIAAAQLQEGEQRVANLNTIAALESKIKSLKANEGEIANRPIDPLGDTSLTFAKQIQQYETLLSEIKSGITTFVPKGTGPDTELKRAFDAQFGGYQDVTNLKSQLALRDEIVKTGKFSNNLVAAPGQIEQARAEAAALKQIIANVQPNIQAGTEKTAAALEGYRAMLNKETEGIGGQIGLLEAEVARLKGVNLIGAAQLALLKCGF